MPIYPGIFGAIEGGGGGPPALALEGLAIYESTIGITSVYTATGLALIGGSTSGLILFVCTEQSSPTITCSAALGGISGAALTTGIGGTTYSEITYPFWWSSTVLPVPGTYDIVMTFSGATNCDPVAYCYPIQGVAATTPRVDAVGSVGTTSLSTTLTSVPAGSILVTGASVNSVNPTVGGTETSRDVRTIVIGSYSASLSTENATAGGTYSHSRATGTTQRMGIVTAELLAA